MTTETPHSVQHLHSINKNDEWGTNFDDYAFAIHKTKINPVLDVCATEENALLDYFFTKKENGLAQEWDKDFWMNPPYSEVTEWMRKAREQHLKHNVSCIILVYAKTDTKWWHEFVEGIAEVYFIKGRLKFVDSDGELSKNSAPYPSCLIVYRRKENAA